MTDIKLRRVNEPELTGKIEVFIDPNTRSITFMDNGMGMDQSDIEEFLSTISAEQSEKLSGSVKPAIQ